MQKPLSSSIPFFLGRIEGIRREGKKFAGSTKQQDLKCRRETTRFEERERQSSKEASPISSLSRVQTRRHGETRILFTIHTLHAHLLDSHFMLFALNCSLRSTGGWVCFHRLEQRTSRDQRLRYVSPRKIAWPPRSSTFSTVYIYIYILSSSKFLHPPIFLHSPSFISLLENLRK